MLLVMCRERPVEVRHALLALALLLLVQGAKLWFRDRSVLWRCWCPRPW